MTNLDHFTERLVKRCAVAITRAEGRDPDKWVRSLSGKVRPRGEKYQLWEARVPIAIAVVNELGEIWMEPK
jgi:hypothetical protein